MSSEKKEFSLRAPVSVPANREAARRPYCSKHSRAMIDIGGEKKCPTCVKEKSQK